MTKIHFLWLPELGWQHLQTGKKLKIPPLPDVFSSLVKMLILFRSKPMKYGIFSTGYLQNFLEFWGQI